MGNNIKINNIIYGTTDASEIIYNDSFTVDQKLDELITIDIEDDGVVNENNDYLSYANIEDSLTSEATNKALSARQGKILKQELNNIDFSSLENKINTNSNKINTNTSNITTLNNKIPFSFGVDANGNYGYIKDGADTVTPFKKGHNIESPKVKISGTVTSVTCNNCIIGNTYMIIYAPWSSGGYSAAAGYLSVSSYSGCEAPTKLYTLNDGYRSTVGIFKVKATSETFKIQWNTGGGGYIIVCE